MINLGILGTGSIVYRFLEGLSYVSDMRAVAVAGRTYQNVLKLNEHYPIAKLYYSYDELLEDKEVDAVYIALPHGIHYPWIKKALEAGKHVLCEKPLALNTKETKELQELAVSLNLVLMEAMKSKFTPGYLDLKGKINNGIIGEIQHIETSFCGYVDPSRNTYHYHSVGGGALLDMGIYNASFIDGFLKGDISISLVDSVNIEGIDVFVDALIKAGDKTARLKTAIDRNEAVHATIIGNLGTIQIPNFHRIDTFIVEKDGLSTTYSIPYQGTDFTSEILVFKESIQNNLKDTPLLTHENTLRSAEILEIIKGLL